jgi:hypothetical protein
MSDGVSEATAVLRTPYVQNHANHPCGDDSPGVPVPLRFTEFVISDSCGS